MLLRIFYFVWTICQYRLGLLSYKWFRVHIKRLLCMVLIMFTLIILGAIIFLSKKTRCHLCWYFQIDLLYYLLKKNRYWEWKNMNNIFSIFFFFFFQNSFYYFYKKIVPFMKKVQWMIKHFKNGILEIFWLINTISRPVEVDSNQQEIF